MQRALLLCDGALIEPGDIELQGTVPNQPSPSTFAQESAQVAPGGTALAYSSDKESIASDAQDMDSVEREHILKVLKQTGGNRKEAVNILGLSERALRYKLKAYKEAGFLFE